MAVFRILRCRRHKSCDQGDQGEIFWPIEPPPGDGEEISFSKKSEEIKLSMKNEILISSLFSYDLAYFPFFLAINGSFSQCKDYIFKNFGALRQLRPDFIILVISVARK